MRSALELFASAKIRVCGYISAGVSLRAKPLCVKADNDIMTTHTKIPSQAPHPGTNERNPFWGPGPWIGTFTGPSYQPEYVAVSGRDGRDGENGRQHEENAQESLILRVGRLLAALPRAPPSPLPSRPKGVATNRAPILITC